MTTFSSDQVREIANTVEKLTGGAFAFGDYNDPGDGGRFTDGIKNRAWRGPFADVRAVAYYAYGAMDWASREQATGEPALPLVITKALAVLEQLTGSHDDATATEADRDRAYAITVAADEGASDSEGRWRARQRRAGN